METIIRTAWLYVQKLPKAYRMPAMVGLALAGGVCAFLYWQGYETKLAHAADVAAVRAEMQAIRAAPSAEDNAQAVADEIERRAAVKAALRRSRRK